MCQVKRKGGEVVVSNDEREFVERSKFFLREYCNLQKKSARNYLQQLGSSFKAISELIEAECPKILAKYEIIEPVACGASGIVLKVKARGVIEEDGIKGRKENCFAAMKIVAIKSRKQKKLCEKEMEIHNQMDHPNIVKLHEFSISDSFGIFVMEWVESSLLQFVTLNHEVTGNREYTEKTCLKIINQTAEALGFVHSKGIVHLDVKLDNILLTDTYDVKLCDFGAAEYMAVDPVFNGSYGSKSTPGTPLYCCPELHSYGSSEGFNLSGKCDVWSLGIVGYILLSGYMPFELQNSTLQSSILSNRFTFHVSHWKNISLKARDLISRLLTKDVTKRPSIPQILSHPALNVDSTREDDLCNKTLSNDKFSLKTLRPGSVFVGKKIYDEIKSLSLIWLKQNSQIKQIFDWFEFCVDSMTQKVETLILNVVTEQKAGQLVERTLSILPNNINNFIFIPKKEVVDVTTALNLSKELNDFHSRMPGHVTWIPDSEVNFCKICDEKFTFWFRKHHCRKCGQIICDNCSHVEGERHSRRCCLCI